MRASDFNSEYNHRMQSMVEDRLYDLSGAIAHTNVGSQSHTALWDEIQMFRALKDVLEEMKDGYIGFTLKEVIKEQRDEIDRLKDEIEHLEWEMDTMVSECAED